MYVYSGKADVVFIFLLPLLIVGGWGDWGWPGEAVFALRALACGGAVQSVLDAWRANRCAWRALIALPAKYVLAACLVVCGFLAVGSALSALGKDKTKGERIGGIATAAAGGYGFLVVRHWIKKTIRPPGIEKGEPVSVGEDAS